MAHIDAGKTTTTERMLYYSGFINHVGEVHTGDTVMDYLDQERDRGITITAAAITLPWAKHQINLIDTPGHVDFTMEVERSLRVTDGAILILDGSAGVQAQTLTVWRQSKRNNVNCIAYINKLDKPNSDLDYTLISMEKKLQVTPLLTQMPIGHGRELSGLIDLVDMTAYIWDHKSSNQGKQFTKMNEDEIKSAMFTSWEEAVNLRENLIEKCCDFDNEIAEEVILSESYDKVDPESLRAGLRRIVVDKESSALVTCLGSSYKNIGVQPLLDSVIHYLPAPSDKHYPFTSQFKDNLCALVFKIIHHPQRGVLSFVRVYSGRLSSKSSIYNVNKQQTEKIGKLMVAFADDFRDIDEIGAGNIAVLSGLKLATTGDTIVDTSMKPKKDSDGIDSSLLIAPIVPDPVFFCSIEPPSLAAQKQFDYALECLSREDPSLRITQEADTGQTVLGGMGELHLEITLDRLKTQYKVDTDMGKLQVAYREIATSVCSIDEKFERKLGDKTHTIHLNMTLAVQEGLGSSVVEWSKDKESIEQFASIKPQLRRAVEQAIMSGLQSGPVLGYPVLDSRITIHSVQIGRGCSMPMLTAGAMNITKILLKQTDIRLAEPVMAVEIIAEEDVITAVLQDLTRRRGEVDYTQDRSTDEGVGLAVLRGTVPLAELRGYSSELRTLSSGKANLSMELSHYKLMTEEDQEIAIEDVTGFSR
eukprot:TRINITY_DN8119_c0_g1_i21.p1 TRINITY_DN8119_c0_g1~~TRINITY_DN8119_c0_g1_i21.p1  ORF type:complete len:702 (-),score=97.02 TRINITY_DN8119_c0_g1_i21:300-2405(-)